METSEDEFISKESRDANVAESSLETGKDLKLLYDDIPDRAPSAKTLYLLTPRENNSVSENTSDQDQIIEMKSSIDIKEEMDNDTMHDDLQIIEPFEENLEEEEEKRKLEMYEKMQKLEEIKERTCRICKEVFSDPLYLLRHKREFHTSPKILLSKEELEPYLLLKNRNACPICSKVINLRRGVSNVSRAHYIEHVMIHCNKPRFKCKICGKTFTRKYTLSAHEKRHIVTLETAK